MTLADEKISAWLDGQLPEEEATMIEAALAVDPKLSDRVARLRGNDALLRTAIPLDDSIPPELMARLGLAEPQPEASVIDLAAARERRAPRRWSMEGWRIAAQFLIVIGVGSLLATPWLTVQGPATQAPAYRTLSSAKPEPSANGLVMFRPGVDAAEVQRIVAAEGARLVGAPTAAKAYRLAIREDRREAVLAHLRARPQVLMAEPIDGAGR